jgi:hypothetical protein
MIFTSRLRTDPSPRQYSEGSHAHLDRRAGPDFDHVRKQIELWASALPPSVFSKVQRRMQSGDEREFESVFFELYVHELLVKTGHSVTHHPVLGETTKRPDFLAAAQGRTVIVEASVVTETAEADRANAARLNSLYDAINQRIKSPDYWISLDVEGVTDTPIPVVAWTAKLQAWIDSLDYTTITAASESFEISHDSAIFHFRVLSKSESMRGNADVRPLGALSAGAEWVSSRFDVAKTLRRKAARYGKPPHPYVIAINCVGPNCDWEEIRDGVFGSDGLWPFVARPVFTRVSAVVAVHHLLPWSIARAGVLVFPNPNAALPYLGPLAALPQAMCDSKRTVIVDGTHPREWFGLERIWPAE